MSLLGLVSTFLSPTSQKRLLKRQVLFTEKPTITRNDLIIDIWKLFLSIPVKDHVKVYKEKSLVLNKQVTFIENSQEKRAIAIDLTDQGHLIVQFENGDLQTLRSGEISLSSWEN